MSWADLKDRKAKRGKAAAKADLLKALKHAEFLQSHIIIQGAPIRGITLEQADHEVERITKELESILL